MNIKTLPCRHADAAGPRATGTDITGSCEFFLHATLGIAQFSRPQTNSNTEKQAHMAVRTAQLVYLVSLGPMVFGGATAGMIKSYTAVRRTSMTLPFRAACTVAGAVSGGVCGALWPVSGPVLAGVVVLLHQHP